MSLILPFKSMHVNMNSVTSTLPADCCAPLSVDPLDESRATAVAAVFKALADPTRLRLVSIVAASSSGEVCACDFPELVDRSQPTVSHHLTQLTEAGILQREQRGKWAWFRLNPATLNDLCVILSPTSP
jgi:ArsR family transcriptional regulator